MRLNAFLAQAGIASRREADELIIAGRVEVNGLKGQLNTQVADSDNVLVDGKPLKKSIYRYILLNKPAGCVSTLSDPQGRKTVIDYVNVAQRVVPVGRLDYDTTGLLLLTNDGALAHKLMHPSFGVEKVYQATVTGTITQELLNKLSIGIMIDGKKTAPATASKKSSNTVELAIHEGRKHQVKKMLRACGLEVKQLKRVSYGGLGLGNLAPGQWRDLEQREIKQLAVLK